LFSDPEMTRTTAQEILFSNGLFDDHNAASEFLDSVWAELQKRSSWLLDYCPFTMERRKIRRNFDWTAAPAYSFLLELSMAAYYRARTAELPTDYVRQGHLFELVTVESLRKRGWDAHHTGWASGITMARFKDVVAGVSQVLNEPYINAPIVSVYESANELGLDLVCHRPFADRRGGRPILLVQCASGRHWRPKANTPDVGTWEKLIAFSTPPQRGFAIPFALSDNDFLKLCHAVRGLVLDRYRLLSVNCSEAEWVPEDLRRQLTAWVEPRIANLPTEL
jgi:hypothetical protein